MKYRKLLCVLLALALLLALAPMAGAEGDLFFVAVNDTIPVTLTSLPYTSGGVVYVPYTAFDARPGGVVSAYNATAQTLSCSRRTAVWSSTSPPARPAMKIRIPPRRLPSSGTACSISR